MALDSDSKKWLESRFGNDVKFDEPMSAHTSLRVGGPAEALITPENMEELKTLIRWSREKKLPFLIVGEGTNLLVRDCGIQGLVIVLAKCLQTFTQTSLNNDDVVVAAMAGVRMRTLCAFALRQGLEGMNFALGIPGTVGGGIMMNAGSSHGSMEQVLESINVLLPTGRTRRIKREDLDFTYRKLLWNKKEIDDHQSQPIILDGRFRLRPSDPEKLKKKARAILKSRRRKQPIGWPSAGCFFKNPVSGKTAGELIELAGLKGQSIGGAQISSKHANFFINRHNASAKEFLALMALARNTVLEKFNIDLEREVKIVGT